MILKKLVPHLLQPAARLWLPGIEPRNWTEVIENATCCCNVMCCGWTDTTVPETLTATITTSSCGALGSMTVTLSRLHPHIAYRGTKTVGGCFIDVSFSCEGSTWSMNVGVNAPPNEFLHIAPVSCDPFLWEAEGVLIVDVDFCPCDAPNPEWTNVQITVTE